jgi:hypothetical protein
LHWAPHGVAAGFFFFDVANFFRRCCKTLCMLEQLIFYVSLKINFGVSSAIFSCCNFMFIMLYRDPQMLNETCISCCGGIFSLTYHIACNVDLILRWVFFSPSTSDGCNALMSVMLI